MDFDYFEQHFKKIDFNSKSQIEQYIGIRTKFNPIEGNYYFGLNYLNNQLTDNRKYHYGIFDFNNTKIFAAVSKVRMGRTQYNRLLDIPICQYVDRENELQFMDLLFDCDYVQQAYISNYNFERLYVNRASKYYRENEYEIADQNFYADVKERLNKKYKNPGRLKIITNGQDYCFRKAELTDKERIFKCFQEWAENKEELHSNILFKNYFSQFNSITQYNLALQYVLMYKEQCIAFVSFIPTLDGYCYQPIQFTIPKTNHSRDETLYRILSQIGELLERLYICELDKLGFKYISYAGSASNNKGLLNNKIQLSSGSIKYYRVFKKSL